MDKLINYVCDELEELEKKAEKGGLSSSEVQYADTLAHLKKNLLKGEELYDEMEGDGYSGNYPYDGTRSMRTDGMSYRRGRSYAGPGRGRGSNARRDSMGRYSSRGGYSRAEGDMHEIVEELRGMMDSLPEEKRHEVERFVEKVDRM